MNITNKLGRVAGSDAAVVICWFSLASVAQARRAQSLVPGTRFVAQAHTAQPLLPGTSGVGCAIQTINGHNSLTAAGGGGQVTNTIHTDAMQVQAWETFSLEFVAPSLLGIKTWNGHDLT